MHDYAAKNHPTRPKQAKLTAESPFTDWITCLI